MQRTGRSTAPDGVVGASGARILVVEDERVLALDLAETLDELGYTVAGTATRGEEAIELARRLHPHLILMDVGLAGEIDGITAAETIRDEHDVPVVFLTAHADDDTLHRATSTDASAYLVKPFKAPELRCVIEIALHKHAADVRLRENERWLELTLQQRTAALEAANSELEAFNYSVAHDLRAPLRGIDSFSQLLIEKYSQQLDDEGLGYLNRVRGAAARMSQLIDALLSLAQVGRGQLQPIELDFSYLVQSVTNEIAAANPERNVRVAVAPGMRAYGDPRLLRIVVANLLENAWKFTARRQRAAVEVGPVSEHGVADVLRARQRRRLRSVLRIAVVRRIPAPACRPRIPRHRDRPGDRPASHRTPRRRRFGRTRGRSRARRSISRFL